MAIPQRLYHPQPVAHRIPTADLPGHRPAPRRALHSANGKCYVQTSETMDCFHDHYVPDKAMDVDWCTSPLLHQSLSKLPTALVLPASSDALRRTLSQHI